jgi:hypothetical protein
MDENKEYMIAMLEPETEARIDQAKERAKKIMNREHETLDEIIMYLQIILAQYYHMPIYSEYFKDKTLDELIFEVEIMNLSQQTSTESASKMLTDDKKEAESLFDDWVDEDLKQGNEETWAEEAKNFMETGNFKGEE